MGQFDFIIDLIELIHSKVVMAAVYLDFLEKCTYVSGRQRHL